MRKTRSTKPKRRVRLSKEHARLIEELNESRNKYRVLIDDNLIGAAVTKWDGRVTEANDEFLRMIGYSRAELIVGKARWDTVTAPDLVDYEREVHGAMARRTGRSIYEKEYIHRNGKRVPVLLAYSMIDKETAIGFAIDLSEQKMVQRQLQDAISAREDFLSIASHELKTPLTTLNLQLEMLRRLVDRREEPLDWAQVDRRLNSFKDQLSRLDTLVGSLLDVTRIRGDRLELHPTRFDFRALTEEVVERMTAEAASKGSQIRLRPGKTIVGKWDKMRMDQVITNLLLNAIKYGNGSPIEISLSVATGNVLLQIKDRGIGILSRDQGRVFDPFERAASQNYGGLGLGLYITRRFVERHGGKIWVESEIKKGSTFFVKVPLEKTTRDRLHKPSVRSNLRG